MTETILDPTQLWLIQEQQGLGKLSKFPPELRSMIWKYILPHNDTTKKPKSTRCRTIPQSRATSLPGESTNGHGSLAILRSSRLLYIQLTEILYHNRTLTICFNQISHDRKAHHTDQPTNIFVPIRGTCRQVDAGDIAFSRFAALDIRIQFCRYRPFDLLLGWVHHFAQAVRAQQQSSKHRGTTASPPKLMVMITTCSSSRRCDCHRLTTDLVDVFCLLRALSVIHGVVVEPSATKIHVRLNEDERRYLPQIVQRFEDAVRDENGLLDVMGMDLGMDFHYSWNWVMCYSGCTAAATSSGSGQSGQSEGSGGITTTIPRTATLVSIPVPAG
ncbi:MAG: hypothetical protein Q9208_004030 [Pyrenodesmia sp. 3 TL-2023]